MVIDASVAFKWLVPEMGSDAAAAWIAQTELLAPSLIHAEVGNALWKLVRRGEFSEDGAAEQLARLPTLVNTVDDEPLVPRAFELAVALRHPVYDCIYLALAERLEDEVLTADTRFVAAVRGSPYQPRVRAL